MLSHSAAPRAGGHPSHAKAVGRRVSAAVLAGSGGGAPMGGRSLAGLRQSEELRVGRKLEPRHERQGGVQREKVNREAGAAVRGGADPARTRREGRVPRDVVGGVRVPRLGSV